MIVFASATDRASFLLYGNALFMLQGFGRDLRTKWNVIRLIRI